jgi:HSP20 family protein
MTLSRQNPFGEMLTLRQAIDRLFEDSFVTPQSWRSGEGQSQPAIDVHETADDVVVTAALPGVKPEDVEITMTGQNLVIRGEFKADEKVERDQYLYQERRYGSFSRQLQLPIRVQGEKAEASFENGVLTLRIPKSEEIKPRQIQIKPGAGRAERAVGEGAQGQVARTEPGDVQGRGG